MDALTQSLMSLLIGGFLGGVIKSLLDYRNKVFSLLWDKRLDAYKILWEKMKLLPLWPKSDDVTYLKLYEMSKEVKDWYFSTGGILMSKKTRAVYGKLQEEINDKILKTREKSNSIITEQEYNTLQHLCHLLRNEITSDLLSRKKQI